jgi:hypothetical protein
MRLLKHADMVRILLLWSMSVMAVFLTGKYARAQKLPSGQVFKIGITKTGVYKIDQQFLKSMGVDVAGLNPEKIRLFGNGGAMLLQKNADYRPDGLTENAIWIQGSEDGRFDAGDALFFYGEGPHVILQDSVTRRLRHQINIYSDTTFYFLSIGTESGLRIQPSSNLVPGKTAQLVSAFTDYWYHESELVNLLKSGREWWGEYLQYKLH